MRLLMTGAATKAGHQEGCQGHGGGPWGRHGGSHLSS